MGSSSLDFSSSSSSFTSLVWTGMDLGGGFFLRAGAVEGRLTARGGMFAWRERRRRFNAKTPRRDEKPYCEVYGCWFGVSSVIFFFSSFLLFQSREKGLGSFTLSFLDFDAVREGLWWMFFFFLKNKKTSAFLFCKLRTRGARIVLVKFIRGNRVFMGRRPAFRRLGS